MYFDSVYMYMVCVTFDDISFSILEYNLKYFSHASDMTDLLLHSIFSTEWVLKLTLCTSSPVLREMNLTEQ